MLAFPETPEKTLPSHKTFPSLKEARAWVEDLLRQGVPVEASQVWYDRIQKPQDRFVKLLGVSSQADQIAKKIAPGGHWTVERTQNKGVHQFSAWYSKFTPYAYAMCQSEEGFNCLGLDFDSINAIYKTCLGFVSLGLGQNPELIEEADVMLFDQIYHKSSELWPPTFPFDEAFRPCAVFLAVRNPQLFKHQFHNLCRYQQHTLAVLRALQKPIPEAIESTCEPEKTLSNTLA